MTAAPFRVVLTGGIASGKSAVADEFTRLGASVFDVDQINRDVVQPGSPALEKIVAAFGSAVLDADGRLDRKRMRDIVFDDPAARHKLEAITHPAIRAELARRSDAAKGPYQIHAIPLYVETGARPGYDRVLVVDCPEALQLERLIKRDHADAVQAQKILAAQATREQRLAVATDIIVNDGTLDSLREQVVRLHEKFTKSAAEKA